MEPSRQTVHVTMSLRRAAHLARYPDRRIAMKSRLEPTENEVSRWLLEGDVAIRWQTLRDVVGSPRRVVERERDKVGRDGWGARLLSLQDPLGTWGRGLYTPKWTSTTYTLLLLRDLGLVPSEATLRGCQILLDEGLRADGGINFKTERSETCITGMTLSVVSYFGCNDKRLDVIAGHLLNEQMSDGGWNCRRWRGATHSSVHTSISVLEGLRLYELRRRTGQREVRAAQSRGREFLLAHRLFRSHRTGKVIKPEFKLFAFPPRWHYDVLRALDYFQAVRAPRDSRLGDAIALVEAKRQGDGRWPLDNSYRGKSFFELERRGQPSRWNTLRALRVLKWWNGQGVR
jgi:hypothetical protein